MFSALFFKAGPLHGRRGERSHYGFSTKNRTHFLRWRMVKDARSGNYPDLFGEKRPTWDEVFDLVAEIKSDGRDAVSADTIRESYQLVERALKQGKGARFFDTHLDIGVKR